MSNHAVITQIQNHGEQVRTPNLDPRGGSFQANGVTYRRDGKTITIGSESYRCVSFGMARYLFNQLTVTVGMPD